MQRRNTDIVCNNTNIQENAIYLFLQYFLFLFLMVMDTRSGMCLFSFQSAAAAAVQLLLHILWLDGFSEFFITRYMIFINFFLTQRSRHLYGSWMQSSRLVPKYTK